MASRLNLKAALQDITFRELLVFDAVVRSGSLSAAARNLHLNAPLVTKSIQRLEARLGFALFVRNHLGASLTAEGQSFENVCQKLFRTLESSGMNRAPLRKPLPLLRFVAPMYLATHLVARFGIPRLLAASLNARLLHLDPSLIADRSTANIFDIAVHHEKLSLPRAWATTPLGAVDWVLCARAGHPLRSHSTESEVAQFAFIAPLFLTDKEAVPGNDHCPLPVRSRVNRVEVNNNEIGIRVCEATDLLLFLPRIQAEPALREGRLRVVHVNDWPPVRKTLYLSAHQDRVSYATLKILTEALSAPLD